MKQQHIDWFSNFCTAHPCGVCVLNTQTDRQTDIVTSTAKVTFMQRMQVMQPNVNNISRFLQQLKDHR